MYNHIEKLLGRNEYVVVPGLGGFVLQQQSATIVDNTITAPYKTISFNALMRHSDGLLVIEIARTEGISYRKAQELLEHETEVVKQQLKSNGIYNFGNLGTFFLTDEGNMAFNPVKNPGFIPSNAGLSDISLPTQHIQHHQFVANYNKSVSVKKYLRYAAVFALLIATLFVSERKSGIPGSQSAAIISLSKFAPTIKADNTLPTDTTKTMQQNDSAAYHVIVASLPTQQSAENFQRFLTDNNYPTAHVLKPVKTYRVAIKSFNDKDEAIRFMENLRSSDERFATAWVLCKR